MSQPLKVILIGTGGFGNVWIDSLSKFKSAKVVGLVDVNPAALCPAATKLNVNSDACFTSLADAMKLDFQAAIICIPPALRPPVYKMLAEAGKHILCEKPLADSIESAKAAVELKKRTGIHFVVSQNYRYFPCNKAVKDIVSSGEFGKAGACQIDFFKYPRFFGFREEMPYPLIIDMSIHHFDLVRYVFQADPISVVGRSWNGPWSVMKGDASSSLIFELSGGRFFSYNSSWTTLRPPSRQTSWNGTWHIECEKGCVIFDNDLVSACGWKLDEKGQPAWEQAKQYTVGADTGSQLPILQQFVDQINGGPVAPTNIQDNIKSVAMVFAAVKAIQTHTKVDIQAMLR